MSNTKESKQVIVIRKDLNMRKGKIAAQAAHASMGSILQLLDRRKYNLLEGEVMEIRGEIKVSSPECHWLDNSFTKTCVSCDTEDELLALVQKAKDKGVLCCTIIDSGKTEFNGVPTLTCAAFGPAWAEDVDEITGNLKLL